MLFKADRYISHESSQFREQNLCSYICHSMKQKTMRLRELSAWFIDGKQFKFQSPGVSMYIQLQVYQNRESTSNYRVHLPFTESSDVDSIKGEIAEPMDEQVTNQSSA